MPSGTRTRDPVSTGIAMSRPNWVELRSSIFLIGMPITPNIIQTIKHTVKASVLTMRTDQAFRVCCGLLFAGGGVCAMGTTSLLKAWRLSSRDRQTLPILLRDGLQRQKEEEGLHALVRKNYVRRGKLLGAQTVRGIHRGLHP